uniref:Uncharacterized protein n=1 Tax=Alexandrium monilatum TaxID=311494 RepID=A0A7S4SQ15_9DINO|mmetsp:Transcript_100481/g.299800  ORF Transcript_100481/g.299800 Transcript_100481/m.299800 type:complete len:334 (-) Transcript_100481:142-1143(-)
MDQAALDEITQQIMSRGDGKVWIDDWRERYGELSPTPKEFMLRHPDTFALSFVGKRYTVTLVQGASWKQDKGACGRSKGGGKAIVPITVPRRIPPSSSPRPEVMPTPTKGGGQVVQAGWGGKGQQPVLRPTQPAVMPMQAVVRPAQPAMALPAPPATEEDAIKEIRKRLAARSDGYLWVPDWKRRFGSLAATQREFLEDHPDLFFLSFEGKKYTVEYLGAETDNGAVEEEEAAPAPAGVKRPLEDADEGAWTAKAARPVQKEEGTEEEALEEFVRQLSNPQNKEGKVWINGWRSRFGHFGVSPREFLEFYPERFTVVAGVGNRYSVRLVDQEV